MIPSTSALKESPALSLPPTSEMVLIFTAGFAVLLSDRLILHRLGERAHDPAHGKPQGGHQLDEPAEATRAG